MQSLAENEYAYCRSTLSSVDILRLNRIWMVLLKGYEEVKGSYNPLISLEMLVIRLCNISQLPDPEKLLQQLYSVGSVGSKDFTASLVEGKSSSHALSSAKIANDVLPISFGAVSNEVMPGKGDWYKGWPGVAEALLHQDEMILYHHVRTDISVVEFGVGEISVVLRNGATKSIIESLRNFLNNNTKIQWIIKIIEQNDDNIEIETLAQLLRQEHANKQEAIARHRDVKLMLESFDGLEIAEIKVA
jgi:DNA polymerase-3 subunit gamma/tau